MASQRPSFAKRDREMKLKDKAKAKAERRAAREANPNGGGGPPIATFEEVAQAAGVSDDDAPASPRPANPPPNPTRPR